MSVNQLHSGGTRVAICRPMRPRFNVIAIVFGLLILVAVTAGVMA